MLERVLSEWPGSRGLGVLLIVAAASFVALALVLWPLGARLDDAGHGIVALELAFSPGRVDRILADWADGGVTDDAILLIRIDFAFLIAYSVLVAGLVLLAAREEKGVLRRPGFVLVVLCLLAGLFDAVENWLDLSMLHLGRGDPVRAPLGAAFAAAKFGILIVAVAFGLRALVACIARRARS